MTHPDRSGKGQIRDAPSTTPACLGYPACPGLIDTPIPHHAVLRGGVDRRMVLDLAATSRPLSPDKCATAILRGVEKNKAIIVVTPLAKVLELLTRISPTAAMWRWRRVFLSRARGLRRG